jgi:hypothetical protein
MNDDRLHEELSETWFVPRGLLGWLSVVDHKSIGRRYIVTAFASLRSPVSSPR